ncbi:OB-fold nucleic acid binding domain-containing protein, partial [Butyrivibrio sp. ob235]|uniref:PolC-type DNA polymerase III N-terminal domain-containing protein n=1 Tax=Butyrivibrio sp. ob235 TaxID=1761780 RepID=UPI0008AF2827
MNKLFFEVFPTLKLDNSIKLIFKDVKVEKVSSTSRQDYIRIYISSRLPIEKNVIYQVEREIKQQLFPDRNLMIKIYEKFLLSSQYTVQTFLDIYWESLLLEFKNYDPVEYTLLRKAEFSYPSGNSLIITIEESVIAEKKAADIIRIFEKVLNERCNLGCKVSISYTEKTQQKEADEYLAEISHFSKKAEEPFVTTNNSNDNNDGSKVVTQKQEEAKPEQKTQKKKGLFHPKSPKVKKNDDPNLIYGRSFDEESVKIEELVGEMGEVVVRGKVLSYERREIKNEKSILMFVITDFTDSIKVKIFAKNEQVPEIEEKLKEGAFVKVKGIALLDRFDHEVSIQSVGGIMLIPDFTTKRVDDAEIKRVELHCHTKMSDMDGVSSVEDICLQAFKWGMPGIAITDHVVTQALS